MRRIGADIRRISPAFLSYEGGKIDVVAVVAAINILKILNNHQKMQNKLIYARRNKLIMIQHNKLVITRHNKRESPRSHGKTIRKIGGIA